MKRPRKRKIKVRVVCRDPKDARQYLVAIKEAFSPKQAEEAEIEIGPPPDGTPYPPTKVFADEQLEQECGDAAKAELDKIDQLAKAVAEHKRAQKAKEKEKTPAAARKSIAQWLRSFFKAGWALTVEKVAKGITDSLTKRP